MFAVNVLAMASSVRSSDADLDTSSDGKTSATSSSSSGHVAAGSNSPDFVPTSASSGSDSSQELSGPSRSSDDSGEIDRACSASEEGSHSTSCLGSSSQRSSAGDVSVVGSSSSESSVQGSPREGGSISESSEETSTSRDSLQSGSETVRLHKLKVPQRCLETLAEHMARHQDAGARRHCVRCQFESRKALVRAECFWTHPVTSERSTWLIEMPGAEAKVEEWGLGCIICRHAGLKTKMANCGFSRSRYGLKGIVRHQGSASHLRALAVWNAAIGNLELEREERTDGDTLCREDATRGVGFGHVLKALELFENQSSLRSYTRCVASSRLTGSIVNPGNESRRVATQLMMVCAGWEKYVNRCLLEASTTCGLAQDAKDPNLLVTSRMVVWALPRQLRSMPLSGVKSLLGKGAPWIVGRVLGVAKMGAERSGAAAAQATLSVVDSLLGGGDGSQPVKDKMRFFTADNAADETVAHRNLLANFPNLNFEVPDTSHSIMLAIKNGAKGDPIVDLVQGVFVTNKQPIPSISNLLRSSF